MTSDLQRDIARVDLIFSELEGGGLNDGELEAWQRIRARLASDVRNPDCGFMFCDAGAGSMPSPALRLSPDRERVARAIRLRYFGAPDSWDALDSHARNSWLSVADAAIAAMGETP